MLLDLHGINLFEWETDEMPKRRYSHNKPEKKQQVSEYGVYDKPLTVLDHYGTDPLLDALKHVHGTPRFDLFKPGVTDAIRPE